VEEGIRGRLSWATKSLSCLVTGDRCNADMDIQAGNTHRPARRMSYRLSAASPPRPFTSH